MDKPLTLKRRRKVSLDVRKARSGYAFVAPFIIGIVLIYLPILIDSILFTFSKVVPKNVDGEYINSFAWVKLDNYKAALNKEFFTLLADGLQRLIFEVPAVVVFSLFIAVVLNQKMLGRAVFRAIFFVPVIISTGLMEGLLHDKTMDESAEGGVEQGGAGQNASTGIISAFDVQNLFGEMKIGVELVGYVVTIVNQVYEIINYSGVQMLIFLAGLQSISPAIYEACQIEGATGWETFWKITFPMISPMILVNSVYTVINAFTRTTNPMMEHIISKSGDHAVAAQAWIYFLVVMLIIAAVAGIVSTFIFYQRKD